MEKLAMPDDVIHAAVSHEEKNIFRISANPDEISFRELDAFVFAQTCGGFFQSSHCYTFYKSMKAYEPVLVCAYDQDNNQAGSVLCIINRLVYGLTFSWITRAIVIGGPVIREDIAGRHLLMELLIKELIRIVRTKSVYLEFRNNHDMSGYKDIFLKHHFRLNDHLNYIIDTSDAQKVTGRMSKTKLQQIRRSRAAGAEIITATDIAEVREWYTILADLYKFRAKKPLPPFRFFETFFRQRKNLGEYILVRYQGRIVGGAMCIVYGNKMVYEWYKCGIDRVFKNVYPSTLASWAAIDYAVKHTISAFDFMGAGKPNQPYGVRDFKAQFGGELVNYGRYVLTLHQKKFELSQKFLKVTGHLR